MIQDGNHLLAPVSKATTLGRDYAPADLAPIPEYLFPARAMTLRREALEALKALWQAAHQDGVTLHILSAYRSYDYQEDLFRKYVERDGESAASQYSARPGQSEHQLGTTVDFGGSDVDFSADFGRAPQGRWLAENAHRFGFAMSYPEGGSPITGYCFEPWHYRYIGREAAQAWKNSGVTLKEFLETASRRPPAP